MTKYDQSYLDDYEHDKEIIWRTSRTTTLGTRMYLEDWNAITAHSGIDNFNRGGHSF